MPHTDHDLVTAARTVRAHAWAPFSTFAVGAALRHRGGRIITGCNVENASYGVGLCAECGLVSTLHATGGGRLVAVEALARWPLERCGERLFFRADAAGLGERLSRHAQSAAIAAGTPTSAAR